MKPLITTLKSLAVIGLLSASQAKAVSFVNGSFETGDLTGWTSTYGVLNPFGTTYGSGMDGAHWAWLAGFEVPITMSQTLTGLTPSSTYNVTFIMASEYFHSDQLTVNADGLNPQTFTAPPFSGGNNFWDTWVSKQYTFTATASTATISFTSVGLNSGGYDVGLDNVQISPASAVPEGGATAMLLGLGMCAIGAVRKKLS